MPAHAIGLLETRGVTPLVAAADALRSHPSILVSGVVRAGGGLLTLVLTGAPDAMREAVDAAARAAERAGVLSSSLVVDHPAVAVDTLIRLLLEGEDGVAALSGRSHPGAHRTRTRSAPASAPPAVLPGEATDEERRAFLDRLSSVPVQHLRRIARATPGFPIRGRGISFAGRDRILAAFRALYGP